MDNHSAPPEPERPPLLLVCVVDKRRAAALRQAATVGRGTVPGLEHIEVRCLVPPAAPPPGWFPAAVADSVDRPYALLVEPDLASEAIVLSGVAERPYPLVQVLVAGVPAPGDAEPGQPADVALVALVTEEGPLAAAVRWRRWSTRIVVRVLAPERDARPDADDATGALRVAAEELGVLPAVIPADPSLREPAGVIR
ncbi:hypothetical protein [Micromonospora sp. DT31]|uniref:hypothetical protein n=1 Tax=Micromonospora sp. DT31 TaxID=3393434 RepID=UPI003CEC6AF5